VLHGYLYNSLVYYTLLAAFAAPLFFAVKYISARLEKTLMAALITSREKSALATQFDTALNNMPHGLCMFDADQRLVVSNQRFLDLVGVAAMHCREGQRASALLRHRSGNGAAA